jgi:VRR-NUC domain
MSLHWTEDEYQAHLRRGLEHEGLYLGSQAYSPLVSEKALQAAVLRVAKKAGYTFAYHTYRSTRSPSGFPDLILCHRDPGHVCYAVECKTDSGQVTPAQEAWLAALAGSTGVVSAVWRPSQWTAIVEQLSG